MKERGHVLVSCYGRHDEIYKVKIRNRSNIIEGKMHIVKVLKNHEYSKVEIEKIIIVYTELASNIIFHAKAKGMMIIKSLKTAIKFYGMEIIAIDSGKGMNNYRQYMTDQYSTKKSLGIGLGAVKRLSSYYDVFSQKDCGTIIMAQFFREEALSHTKIDFSGVCLPLNNSEFCGDHWSIKMYDHKLFLILVDGLGHGEDAAKAADVALEVFNEYDYKDVEMYLDNINLELFQTRGAAVSIAELDLVNNLVRYTGLGNIQGRIMAKKRRNLVSKNGTGGNFRRGYLVKEYDFPEKSTIIMASDGISSYSLGKYHGLLHKHPSIISAVIFRDYSRAYDDASILVVKRI